MIGSAALWLASTLAAAPELPLTRMAEPSLFQALLAYPPIKSLLPIPVLLALAPVVRWFFGSSWVAIDREALGWRRRPEAPARAPRPGRPPLRRRGGPALPATASRPARIVRLRRRRPAALPAPREPAGASPCRSTTVRPSSSSSPRSSSPGRSTTADGASTPKP
jgi:hypothetical protein